jgi:hypothetical protein
MAAQAVETAVLRVASAPGFERRRIVVAAAFRAAADRMMSLIGDIYHPKYLEGVEASVDFLEKIAAELEVPHG